MIKIKKENQNLCDNHFGTHRKTGICFQHALLNIGVL